MLLPKDTKKKKRKKQATTAEREHMGKVAALGCIIDGCYCQAEIHHIRTGMGMGQRASHFMVLPLCTRHHRTGGYKQAIHAGQKAWEEINGTEVELLIKVEKKLGELYEIKT